MDTSSDWKPPFKFVKVQQSIFLKVIRLPYDLKEKTEQVLQRLEEEEVIYSLSKSDWAAPVALVPEKDDSLRVCG